MEVTIERQCPLETPQGSSSTYLRILLLKDTVENAKLHSQTYFGIIWKLLLDKSEMKYFYLAVIFSWNTIVSVVFNFNLL